MPVSISKLSGRSLIGFREGTGVGPAMYASNPITGERMQPGFIPATAEEVELAVRLAAEAFDAYRRVSGRERGAFLRKIAEKIEAIAADIVERAGQETALPPARLQGETARTCGQLRLFAQVAEDGSWVNARIDRGDPELGLVKCCLRERGIEVGGHTAVVPWGANLDEIRSAVRILTGIDPPAAKRTARARGTGDRSDRQRRQIHEEDVNR